MKSKIKCTSCEKNRSRKNFLPDETICMSCKFHGIIQTDYKKCKKCLLYHLSSGYKNYVCNTCYKKSIEYTKKYRIKTGVTTKEARKTCATCNTEKSAAYSFKRNTDSCKTCVNHERFTAEGKLKCPACRSYRATEEFINNAGEDRIHCQKCRLKGREKWRKDYYNVHVNDPEYCAAQAQRSREYYHRHKDERRAYRRHYYWNVQKVQHNKIICLQWAFDLIRRKKINRNGYWFMLNRQLFKGFRQSFSKEITMQNKVIEFLRTGKGRIVGDHVILDSAQKRREYDDYLDTQDAMEAPTIPKYEPEKHRCGDYFKE